MANTLRIKRRPSSGSAGAPSSLYNGELAFNENDNILYYGYGSGIGGVATSFPSIGGSGAYTLLGGTNATGTWPIGITGNAGTVTSGVYTSRTLTAGSGLVGGGDLSANRTFDIGQGDGISVSADSIAVDSTVIRTTGTQTLSGAKTFTNQVIFSGNLGQYLIFKSNNAGNYANIVFDGNNYDGATQSSYITSNTGNMEIAHGQKIQLNSPLEVKAANTSGNSVGYFAVFDSNPASSLTTLKSVSKDQILDDIGAATSGLTLTAGSGLTGGGTLSTDRTFHVGQGDGITVSADTVAVDSTVVRTTGTQTINGGKTFGNTTTFNSGIISSSIQSIDGGSISITDNIIIQSAITSIEYNPANGDYAAFYDLDNVRNTFEATNVISILANNSSISGTYFPVWTTNPNTSAEIISSRTASQLKGDIGLGNVENTSLSSVTFTAGSGLVGGGTLASSRTFDIGQGDGISVSADSIAVDSTVVRTTGTQSINGVKTLGNTTYFNSGIISSGTNNIQAASTGSAATQFAVFNSSPNSSAQTVYTRTPSEVKTDIGLSNVTNDAQVKKIASTTIGYIPTWAVTSGDQLATGYSVETTLTGGSTAIARADAVKTYIDNLLGANDAMIFKGTIGTGGTVTALPTTYSAGWTYRVITAGTYAGIVCEIGDLIIAVIDRSGSGNLNSDWTVAQTNIDGAVINTRTLTAGSGLTGGGDLSADRTFNIGAGDGITVNADDVAVDSTVVRTTGTQNITGNKNFSGTVVSSGTLSLKMATTASTATQFPVFTSDPSSTAQTVSTRTPSQVKTDIGLSNVENTALSTWAGSTNITTLGTIGTGTWSATTIAANKGGTGQSSYTIGDLLYADTSSTLAKLADVATGNVLLAGGVATAPSWGKVNLTSGTHVSGTLPVTNGGTGQSSYTDGQLLIGNSTGNTLTKATLTEGTGIDITNGGGSITIIHEDTSTLSGAQGTNGIASITVDGLGHVTAVTTATYLTAATVCAAITDCTLDGGTF